MFQNDQTKIVPAILPAAIVNNGSFTSVEVDTKGYGRATFVFQLGALDIAMTVLKVQHTDTTGSGYADLTGPNNFAGVATGAIFGTSAVQDADGGAASALPSATDDNKTFVIDIDTRNCKRFLKSVATIGNGSTGGFVTAHCILSRPEIGPNKAADRNVAAVLRV